MQDSSAVFDWLEVMQLQNLHNEVEVRPALDTFSSELLISVTVQLGQLLSFELFDARSQLPVQNVLTGNLWINFPVDDRKLSLM